MLRLKYICPILALVFSCITVDINANETECQLPVMVNVSESNVLDEVNRNHLADKIVRILTTNGYGGEELSHLCLETTVSESDKSYLSGTNPLVVCNLEVNMVMTNVLSGEKFGSITTEIKGTGKNENQAVRKALGQFTTGDEQYRDFLYRCRKKIMEYYQSQMPVLIRQSEILADRGQYENALYLLATIPPCVTDYDKVGDAMISVWQTYLDTDCNDKLAKAKAIWYSSQNDEAAQEAAAYIAAISRKSSCVEEADNLLAEIRGKIGYDISRRIAQEDEDRAFEKEIVRAEIDLRREKIEAIRDLSLAFVQNVIGPVMDNMTQKPEINIVNSKPEDQ